MCSGVVQASTCRSFLFSLGHLGSRHKEPVSNTHQYGIELGPVRSAACPEDGVPFRGRQGPLSPVVCGSMSNVIPHGALRADGVE